jgi:hypothetical protein
VSKEATYSERNEDRLTQESAFDRALVEEQTEMFNRRRNRVLVNPIVAAIVSKSRSTPLNGVQKLGEVQPGLRKLFGGDWLVRVDIVVW